MTTAATVSEVRRRFGRTQALDGATFEIGTGVTGLLGPNGAGKTTLLRILATVSAPDSGQVSVFGRDPSVTPVSAPRSVAGSATCRRTRGSSAASASSSSSTTSPSSRR